MKQILKNTSLTAAVSAICALAGNNANAINGVFDYGVGQITRGMGGAGIAMTQDAFAGFINPAGLGLVNHSFDAGAAIYFPDMYSKYGAGTVGPGPTNPLAPPQGKFESQIKVFFMPDIGYVRHYNQRNHFALAINALGGFGTKYSTNKSATVFPGVPSRGLMGDGTVVSSLKIGEFSGSYNYFINRNLSIGLTLGLFVQDFKSAGSQGLAPFTKTSMGSGGTATPTKLSNNGNDYNYGLGGTAGILYRFNNYFAIGATAMPKVNMTKMKDYKDLLPNGGELDIPARYAAGVNIAPNDRINLLFDVVRIENKKVGAYGHNSQALFNGQCNPFNTSACFGGKNGPGFGWQNQTVMKIGGAYKLNARDTVRLGVSYGNRIAKKQDIVVNTLAPGAAAKLLTSAGYSRDMKCYTLNSFLTYIPSQELSGINQFSAGAAQKVRIKIGGIGFGFGASW